MRPTLYHCTTAFILQGLKGLCHKPYKKKHVSLPLVSARQSRPVRINIFFFFNLFFFDAPCDPSTPSSKYTRYHRLQNVLASINHHILYIESWIKSGIIYFIHIPFFSYLRIKFTTISLLFSPSGISLPGVSKKKKKIHFGGTVWPETLSFLFFPKPWNFSG
jgi:hypothetical protein